MGILKKLTGDTAVYGLSSIVGRFLNYLLVPLYTAESIFSRAEYGVVTELYAYAAFLNVVFTYGMETTYFRQCNKQDADKERVFVTIQSLVTVSTLVLCSAMIIFSSPIASLLEYPTKGNLFILLAAIVGFDTLLAVPFARLRQEGKAKKFAFIKVLNIVLNIGLNLLLLVWLPHVTGTKPSVEMVLIANLFANAAQFIFFVEYLLVWRYMQLHWSSIKLYVMYGLPLMVIGFAGMINEVIDRIVLKFLLPENFYVGITTLAAVGIYGACYKLANLMSLGLQAFRYASEPFFFSKSKEKDSPTTYAYIMHWFVLTCTATLLLISLNLDWLKHVLRNPEYWNGLVIVPILLVANLFLGVYYNLSIWYKLTDKTYYGMWISIVGAGITIVLNIVLVPVLGYLGSAWATLGCYATMTAISYVAGQRAFYVPYHIPFILGCILVGACVSVYFWDAAIVTFPFANILLKNGIAVASLGILYVFGKSLRTL